MEINKTLKERGAVYGDFGEGTRIEAEIMGMLDSNHHVCNDEDMSDLHKVWISKIVMKLMRLSVTPTHVDSWHDIAGYATLVEKELTCPK